MKTRRLILIIITVVFFGCAKDEAVDYRLQTVGTFSGDAVHYTTFDDAYQYYQVFKWKDITLTC